MATKTLSASIRSQANGYNVETYPTSTALAGASDIIVTPSIDGRYLSGKKFVLGYKIVVAFDDVAAQLTIEASLDGTNWVEVAVVDSDTTPNVTGQQLATVDFTAVHAPYFRICFNKNTPVAVNTSGTLQLSYAVVAAA